MGHLCETFLVFFLSCIIPFDTEPVNLTVKYFIKHSLQCRKKNLILGVTKLG